ncbi:MAG: hypothetical protein J2P28_13665 [Actinobacteria bacterium]|nr:hypothetical protein [Actinomycetota bacterium]
MPAPIPGLDGPAQRMDSDRRPRALGLLFGFIFLSFVLVYLFSGGPPSGGWAAALWPVVLVIIVLVLVVFLAGQGEVRSGPGWIAARRGPRWQVVKFDAAASVRLSTDPSYGYVLRFGSREGRQHVDLTPPMVRRPGVAPAAAALVDEAASRGAAIDPAVAAVFEALGLPGRGAAGVAAGLRARVGEFQRPRRLRRWAARTLIVLLCVEVGAVVLVIVVRLLGFH